MKIKALLEMFCKDVAISGACLSLCRGMQSEDTDVEMWVPSSSKEINYPIMRRSIPPILNPVFYRLRTGNWLNKLTSKRYLASIESGMIAYLWPGTSLSTYTYLKKHDIPIVIERINCNQSTYRSILTQAYDYLKWPNLLPEDSGSTEGELERQHLADYIFAPSPAVKASIVKDGIPEKKLLSVSYGWEPKQFNRNTNVLPQTDGITALFVGTGCVRKGVPLLLDIWSKAGIKGRLILVGQIDEDVATHCAEHLNREDIELLGWVDDLIPVFQSADLFIFPTLEEGSPLVSYLAIAAGLPMLVSPMAAGGIVRDGIEGIVLDPYDTENWIDSLRKLATNKELRESMASAAYDRASNFTWDKAASVRRQKLNTVFA